MARFEAQKWKRHRDEDCRELVTAWSFPTQEEAEAQAITFAEQLQTDGFELELFEGDGVHGTKGSEQFVVCVAEKPH